MIRYYYSYKSLFKIRFRVYSIGNFHLPRSIPVDSLGLFLIMALPSFLLAGLLTGIFHTNRFAIAILINIFLTSVAHKFDPQGRPFLGFIYDFILFMKRPKKRDFYQSVPTNRKHKLKWDAIDLDF